MLGPEFSNVHGHWGVGQLPDFELHSTAAAIERDMLKCVHSSRKVGEVNAWPTETVRCDLLPMRLGHAELLH